MAKKASAKPSASKPAKKSAAKATGKSKDSAKAKVEVKKSEPKKTSAKPAKQAEMAAPESVAPVERPVKAAKVPKVPAKTKKELKLEAISSQAEALWAEYYSKHGNEKAQTYDMKSQFEAHKPLQHKVLGWGWIASNENDRLEVIFKDGKRMLISNYKSR